MFEPCEEWWNSVLGEKPNVKGSKVCNRCDKGGLHWEESAGRWRLFEPDGSPHFCDEKIDF